MPKFDTQVQELKYRILKEVAKSYDRGTLEEDVDQIPYVITPHGAKPTFRCCVYHEREIVKERVKLAMGGDKKNPNIVEVIPSACDQCPFGGITVTSIACALILGILTNLLVNIGKKRRLQKEAEGQGAALEQSAAAEEQDTAAEGQSAAADAAVQAGQKGEGEEK